MWMQWVLWAVPDSTYAALYGPTAPDGYPDERAVQRLKDDIDAWESDLEAELLPPEEGIHSTGLRNIADAARGRLEMPLLGRLMTGRKHEDPLCRHYSSAETKALLVELERFARSAPDSLPMQPEGCFQGDYLDRVAAAARTDRGLWAWFA